MVDKVSKISIISMVCVASSMRSAKLFWASKPKKSNDINKKAARKGSFFCRRRVVAKFIRRRRRVLRILRQDNRLSADCLFGKSHSFNTDYAIRCFREGVGDVRVANLDIFTSSTKRSLITRRQATAGLAQAMALLTACAGGRALSLIVAWLLTA